MQVLISIVSLLIICPPLGIALIVGLFLLIDNIFGGNNQSTSGGPYRGPAYLDGHSEKDKERTDEWLTEQKRKKDMWNPLK